MRAVEGLAVERSGAGLRARGQLPQSSPWFEGHFPGEPVLPAVVQLVWVLALAERELGLSAAPSALEALKFREPLLPDQPFELRLERKQSLTFALESEGRALASGRLRFDREPHPHTPEPLPPPSTATWPLRLPHAGPMRWVTRVRSHRDGVTVCEARVPSASPLCRAGRAPSVLALELLAQGMAAQGGLAVASADAPALRGLLVGARRVELRARGFAADEPLWVHVRHLRGEQGLVMCRCALGSGKLPLSAADAEECALAGGTLTAFVESAKD
jgi:predicted hotdog family 3-hydroxylacyl-ACP dehydratase/3-hydroxymyristoyl/3-hydroxydecanoyl-(acyl carrier protein) dehydratase